MKSMKHSYLGNARDLEGMKEEHQLGNSTAIKIITGSIILKLLILMLIASKIDLINRAIPCLNLS
jgi:hypothetical protein